MTLKLTEASTHPEVSTGTNSCQIWIKFERKGSILCQVNGSKNHYDRSVTYV